MDYSLPGSSVHGIFKTRTPEWVPFPSPEDLPDPEIKSGSPTLQADSLPIEPPRKPLLCRRIIKTSSLWGKERNDNFQTFRLMQFAPIDLIQGRFYPFEDTWQRVWKHFQFHSWELLVTLSRRRPQTCTPESSDISQLLCLRIHCPQQALSFLVLQMHQ